MHRRRAVIVAAVIVAAGFALYPRLTDMSSTRTHQREIRRLLGGAGDDMVTDDTRLAAWLPDPNYKPQAYYLVRPLDEPALRALAQRRGLSLAPSAATTEAIWRLPAGLVLPGWAADAVPPGAGLQAQATLGSAAVWLRWHQGLAYIVVMPSAP